MAPSADGAPPDAEWGLLFRTDFDAPGARGTPSDAITSLSLENLVVPPAGSLLIPDPVPLPVFYEAGTTADRYARLVPDPDDPSNQVLHLWLQNAVIPDGSYTKGRVQTTVGVRELGGMSELYTRQRVYLHPDLGLMEDYPETAERRWLGLTVHEMWFGGNWEGHPTPARISLVLTERAAGGYTFVAHCDDVGTNFWSQIGDVEVPLGEWMTIELGYRMGDAEHGRFVVRIERGGQAPVTMLDVTDYTYNPAADAVGGVGPVPLSHLQPQKLYTSDNVAHHIRSRGGAVQLYFDDFEIAERWPPAWP